MDDDGAVLWIPFAKTRAGRRRVEVPVFLQPLLVEWSKGRPGAEFLFRYRTIGIVRNWVKRICVEAKVPKVSAHAMRGLHGTLAVDAGVTSHLVAAAMGHESFKTTATSYAKGDRWRRRSTEKRSRRWLVKAGWRELRKSQLSTTLLTKGPLWALPRQSERSYKATKLLDYSWS